MNTSTDNERRGRIHARVGIAARILPPVWPVQRFVAVNPLTGLEDLPVELAVNAARRLRGVTMSMTEQRWRELHLAGRISDADLIDAIAERFPQLRTGGTVRIAGYAIDPVDLVRLDLLVGPSIDEARLVPITRAEWVDHATGSSLADGIDAYVARWMASFLDDTAPWSMPNRDGGLYQAWRGLAGRDPGLARLAGSDAQRFVSALPARADDALLELLVLLAVEQHDQIEYFQRHLCRLAGWAGALTGPGANGPDRLVDFLALRLAVEAAAVEEGLLRRVADQAASAGAPVAPMPDGEERARRVLDALVIAGPEAPDAVSLPTLAAVRRVLDLVPMAARFEIWQDAYETNYRLGLLASLDDPPRPSAIPVDTDARPTFTAVFCIDPRSEGLRRHLESELGESVETVGYAGFFGLPVAVEPLDAGAAQASCPVILNPRTVIAEVPIGDQTERHAEGLNMADSLTDAWKEAKANSATKFSLAETAGWVLGPLAMLATASPRLYGSFRRSVRRRSVPPIVTRMGLDRQGNGTGMDLADQIATAHVIVTTLGQRRGFGRLVLLCGHGSHHINNPFRSALDCGACGGRAGGDNARTAASLLNRPSVRAALAAHGTDFGDTYFVAGEHHTTTDEIILLDVDDVPESHRAELAALKLALDRAGGALALERSTTLVQPLGSRRRRTRTSSLRSIRARADDWAQVVPEWGLANNAAFVVGPRTLTSGVDLGRRVFLHSYEAAEDGSGTVLEALLTGPMVVAHWISSQYFASTVERGTFGAGVKPLHNVIGDLGVLEGSGGDLRSGLPVESVSNRGIDVHEPMRLLLVVEAPTSLLESVLARNPVLTRLFGNGWVTAVARDDDTGSWARRSRTGEWLSASRGNDPVTFEKPGQKTLHTESSEVVA